MRGNGTDAIPNVQKRRKVGFDSFPKHQRIFYVKITQPYHCGILWVSRKSLPCEDHFGEGNLRLQLSFCVSEQPKKTVKKEPKIKKLHWKRIHFYPKVNIGQFLIEEGEIKIGDTILIKGETTGEQKVVIDKMFVNDIASKKAVAGDTCTFKLGFRIRLSDKLYKVLG